MPFLCRNGRCRNTIGGFVCECADGYVLAQDGQHCRDIDECDEVYRFTDSFFILLVTTEWTCTFLLIPTILDMSYNRQMIFRKLLKNDVNEEKHLSIDIFKAANIHVHVHQNAFLKINMFELLQIPGLCPSPGKCQNLMGSYICSCPPGYELDHTRRRCVGTFKIIFIISYHT